MTNTVYNVLEVFPNWAVHFPGPVRFALRNASSRAVAEQTARQVASEVMAGDRLGSAEIGGVEVERVRITTLAEWHRTRRGSMSWAGRASDPGSFPLWTNGWGGLTTICVVAARQANQWQWLAYPDAESALVDGTAIALGHQVQSAVGLGEATIAFPASPGDVQDIVVQRLQSDIIVRFERGADGRMSRTPISSDRSRVLG